VKLGLGLYNHTMTTENFRFARQAGATHLVIHTPIFRHGGDPDATPALWTEEDLRELKAAINAEGLEFEAIENFLPAHWSEVLLDGPRKAAQMEDLKGMIRAMGRAGIPVMGYKFT
jgi:mannonate dehydratase